MTSDASEPQIEHTTRAVELVSIFKALAARQNMHLDNAWAQMFDVSKSSQEFYSGLGAISHSLDNLEAEIGGSKLRQASKDLYGGAVKALRQYVLIERLQSLTTDNLKKELDAFRLLTLLDDVLEPTANRQVLIGTLEEWHAALDDLISSASEALDNPVLREFVIRQLSSLQWAIRNYDSLGIEGVSRAYGAMAAELARSQGMRGAQTNEARGWYQRAKKPIVALGIGIAATSVVVEKADNLLTHGGHIYEVVTGATPEKDRKQRG
jgi:hypothetical protein